uniref:Uncharacterized protein n=1 Tax=Salix viminalis TaxID=40686 RepID=A0A6N2LTB9_SALVM
MLADSVVAGLVISRHAVQRCSWCPRLIYELHRVKAWALGIPEYLHILVATKFIFWRGPGMFIMFFSFTWQLRRAADIRLWRRGIACYPPSNWNSHSIYSILRYEFEVVFNNECPPVILRDGHHQLNTGVISSNGYRGCSEMCARDSYYFNPISIGSNTHELFVKDPEVEIGCIDPPQLQ